MNPRVSINLCCYNGENYLREALESIANQTFKDWELVFINDGSTDSTEKIILDFKERVHPVIYHYQKNKGLGTSRNEALKRSHGVYIAFIDHDDVWLPEKLQRQVEILDKNQDTALVYTNYFKLMPNGKKYPGNRKMQPEGDIFEYLLYYYSICLSTVMARKGSLEELDTIFDENLGLAEETDVFMRILYREKASYIAQPLSVYRIHSSMSTVKYIDKYPEENAYMVEKFKKMDPFFVDRYSDALNYYEAKLGYWRARAEIAKGSTKKAREALRPYKWTDYRFFILYVSTYVSPRLWRIIHDLKDKWVYGGG